MATEQFDPNAFIQAWNSGDVERILQDYAEDATYQDAFMAEPVQGAGAIREVMETIHNAFTGMDIRVVRAVQEGREVALLLEGGAEHTGALRLPDGPEIQPTGRRFRTTFSDFLTLDDAGRVTAETIVFDTGAVLAQLGVEAPMEAAGPA